MGNSLTLKKIINHKFGGKAGIIRIIAVAYFMWNTQQGYAAPLGLPHNTAKIGYSAAYAYISVDDPDGNSKDNWAGQPLNLVYTDWLFSDVKPFSDLKHWTEIFYFKTSLDADENNIGQNLESYGIRFSLQKSFRLTASWSPWFGAGIDVARTRYTARHTRDANGFLLQSFAEREDTGVSLLLNFVSEWSLQEDWSLAAKLEQSFPISEDISQFSAAAVLLYRY
jgi:hypothetical protein